MRFRHRLERRSCKCKRPPSAPLLYAFESLRCAYVFWFRISCVRDIQCRGYNIYAPIVAAPRKIFATLHFCRWCVRKFVRDPPAIVRGNTSVAEPTRKRCRSTVFAIGASRKVLRNSHRNFRRARRARAISATLYLALYAAARVSFVRDLPPKRSEARVASCESSMGGARTFV